MMSMASALTAISAAAIAINSPRPIGRRVSRRVRPKCLVHCASILAVGAARKRPAAILGELAMALPPERKSPKSGGAADAHALFGNKILQLACLEHLTDDVAPADKLTLHVELGNRRPLGIVLDALPQIVGGENVDTLVVNAEIVENLYDLSRKSRTAGSRAFPS